MLVHWNPLEKWWNSTKMPVLPPPLDMTSCWRKLAHLYWLGQGSSVVHG